MKKIALMIALFLIACSSEITDDSQTSEMTPSPETKQVEEIVDELDEEPSFDWSDDTLYGFGQGSYMKEDWKHQTSKYLHFLPVNLDTIYVGTDREIKDLATVLKSPLTNTLVLIDEGEYYSEGLWLDGQNVIIRGEGDVSIYCNTLYENVMWVQGSNIVIDNLHMMHKEPGTGEDQNCSGRVLAFDNADSVTVTNCDLNGCGLAGLHDNLGNGIIWVYNNYIHNNSLGAYTDIDGGIWLEPVENHAVFQFDQNVMTNNGEFRVYEKQDYLEEEDMYEDY